LNAVAVPSGVDEAGVRRRLLEDYGLEIGAGMGRWRGRSGGSGSWDTRPGKRTWLIVCGPWKRFWGGGSDAGGVVGAGLQAQAACFDLVRQKDLAEITVADSDPARAEALARRWNDPRVKAVGLTWPTPAR